MYRCFVFIIWRLCHLPTFELYQKSVQFSRPRSLVSEQIEPLNKTAFLFCVCLLLSVSPHDYLRLSAVTHLWWQFNWIYLHMFPSQDPPFPTHSFGSEWKDGLYCTSFCVCVCIVSFVLFIPTFKLVHSIHSLHPRWGKQCFGLCWSVNMAI